MAKSDNGELNKSDLASNTSDPNNSLLQKVTKRVSGLFPSSLTKWFGPSEGPQSVIRRRESADEDDEATQLQEPPKKRAKPSTDVDFSSPSSFGVASTPILLPRSELRGRQRGPSGYTRRQATTATSSTHYEASSTNETVVNGDDKSDSGESTSGYSSVLAQQHKESSFVSDRGNALNQPSTSKSSPNKSLNASMNSSRSLFSDQSLNPQRQCLSSRRPSFSASTFGSPSFVDRTLSTKRAVNSPFYGGRTTYGGASAYRRNRIIFPRDQANNVAVKNSINIKPVNDESSSGNDSVSLSKTARRILDALEHFSTPVLDAKKIPNISKQNNELNKSAIQRKTPYAREGRPPALSRELLVPSVPDLLKMKLKERLQDSTVQVRKVATTSKSVLNSEYSIRAVEGESQKHVTKIKSKVTSVGSKKDNLQGAVDAVHLPEVKLPITTLPKFDFTLPPPPTVITKPVTKSSPIRITTKTNESANLTSPVQYKFANPIIVSEIPKSITSINNFKFSEPLDAKSSNTKQSTLVTNSPTPTITFRASYSNTAPRRKNPAKNNGQNNAAFSQPPTQFVSGSVMDVLRKPEKKPESDNLMDKFKPDAGTWECSACMVRNIPSATRCLACETLKEPPKKVEAQLPGFGSKFKMTTDKWECSACMVRNVQSETKCVACTTPKPSSAPTPAVSANKTPVSSSFDGFGDKFKPESGTWECSACMIRNKNEAIKCIACETPKPGSKPETKSTLIMPVEIKTNSGFGELIKKQQSNWECPSCMVRNQSEKKSCVCCEAPKPGEQQEFNFGAKPLSGPQYKFGIDKASSTPSTGFKFGVEKSSATTPTTFSFGIKPTDKTTESKPTTPIVAATSSTPGGGFTFGVQPASKSENKNNESLVKPSSISTAPGWSPQTTNETIKASTLTFSSPASTTSSAGLSAASPPSFSFGTPASTTSSSAVPKPEFSFGTTASTPATTSSVASATTNSTNTPKIPPATVAAPNVFGNITDSTAAKSFSSVPATSTTTVSAATTLPMTPSPIALATFVFGPPCAPSPALFSSENNVPVPQFNFGAGGLPFNPVYPTTKTVTTTTNTTNLNFGTNTPAFSSSTTAQNKSEPPSYGAATNPQQSFSFNASSGSTTNNNKSEVKPFSFAGGTGEPAAKVPAFSFTPNDNQSVPLAKVPVYNFASSGANSTPEAGFAAPTPASNMFGFGAGRTDKPPAFGSAGSTMFGQSTQPASTPQNGGFSFGSTSVAPNFNFGAGPGQTNTPAVFGFGSSQAGTGSTGAPAAPPASAPGVFAFGGGPPAQQQAPAFLPDNKSIVNFNRGFASQAAPSSMPQRKIRKAVRRTQPR